MSSSEDDLLERYLQAIGQYLPAASREDTLAELRANLLEQMDAGAEELGRPLSELEVTEMLRAHGRPETVAARYLPQRSLIGPALFPSYQYTFRKATPFVLFVYAIVTGIRLISAAPTGPALITSIVKAAFELVPTLLIFWAVVTIVFATFEFAYTEYGEQKKWDFTVWDPTKLPPVKRDDGTVKRKSLASRIADLVIHCFWMMYVLAVPAHPFLLIGPGVYYLDSYSVRLAPVWHTFFLLLIDLLAVQLVMKIIAVVDQENPWLRLLGIVPNVLSVVAWGIMVAAGEYFVAAGPAANLQRLADVNHGIGIAFRIAFLFAVIGLLTDGWKSLKRFVPVDRLAF